jgi:signal transduction histidine kinase
VEQQQYLFETLWNKAIPAEALIRALEGGIRAQSTEVNYGPQKVIERSLWFLDNVTQTLDLCGDSNGPAAILAAPPVLERYLALHRKGVRIRHIVEITKENLPFAKRMLEFGDVRHLDGLNGYFAICDAKLFASNTLAQEGGVLSQIILSSVAGLVEQQQYFFNTLWEKAVPAGQRISELEEGKEPEVIELIHDTQKSISRAFDLMHRTRNELLVLFATPNTFSLAMSAGAADIYKELSENGTKVKILVPAGKDVEGLTRKAKAVAPLMDIKTSNESLGTRLTIMVCDRKVLMSWELRDDNSPDPYEAGGVATYTNFESIAGSYAVILDNLWMSTEFAENLRTANEKLESKERAMKEFINIAAHELRTPIQPILGLSEVLRDRSGGNGHQTELVDAIIRNAKRLARLQEDILDVTRIESDLLRLTKTSLSVESLVKETIAAFQTDEYAMNGSVGIKFECESSLGENMLITADRSRVSQVISNLLSNSLKFMNGGTIRISARIADDREMIVISVKDSGIGIDEEILPRLFTKFASKSKKGTGLGLYICKNIIEAHGGRIWGENNTESPGATFSFTLPIKPKE